MNSPAPTRSQRGALNRWMVPGVASALILFLAIMTRHRLKPPVEPPVDPSAAARVPVDSEPTRVFQARAAAGSVLDEIFALASKADGEVSAVEWMNALMRLQESGVGGLAGIARFMAGIETVPLPPTLAAAAGYPTLRLVLLDVLGRCAASGDAVARDTLKAQLYQVSDPMEVALTARWLDTLSPGEYRPEILHATRQALAGALGSHSQPQEVAPLFVLVRAFGDSSIGAELLAAGQAWPDYSAWTLSGLTGGSGVDWLRAAALKHDTVSEGELSRAAVGQLAELTLENDRAQAAFRDALDAQVISPLSWARLAQALSGDRLEPAELAGLTPQPGAGTGLQTGLYAGSAGGQALRTRDGLLGVPPQRISAQIRFLEALRPAVSDPDARERLDWARDRLSAALRMLLPGPAAPQP